MRPQRFLFGILVLLMPTSALAKTVREISGQAKGLKTGQPVYHVEAKEIWMGQRQARFSAKYIDPHGRVRMTRHVVHHTDPLIPDERIEHPLTGKLTQTTRVKAGVRLSYRKKTGAVIRSVVVSPPRPYLTGAGLSPYLSSQRDALVKGKTLRFVMLAPSRLDWYRFRARKSSAHPVKPGQFLVAVDTDAAVLRLFVSTMYFWFDTRTGGLMRYDGPVSVEDDDGDMLNVRIDFPLGLGSRPD